MIWLIAAVLVWGVIHSLMASLKFKGFLKITLGTGVSRYYRFFYNVFSAVSFLPVLYLMLILPDTALYRIPPPWSLLMMAGQGISVILLIVTLLQTDVLSFVGLRQVFEEEKPGKLVKGGFYRIIRHPLYTFGLLVLWLSPAVSLNLLVFYASLTFYIVVGAVFEERKLIREFGEEYIRYKTATPMLLPRLPFGGNKH